MPTPEYVFASAMFVGYFDYAVFCLLAGASVWRARRGVSLSLGDWSTLAVALVFCLLLPLLSISVEIDRTRRPPGVPVDAFELLYTYLRFPLYWALFALQLLFWRFYRPSKGRCLPPEH